MRNPTTIDDQVWIREYTHATVVLNARKGTMDGPTSGGSVARVSLAPGRYTDIHGNGYNDTAVLLPPLGAIVLLKVHGVDGRARFKADDKQIDQAA